MVLKFGRFCFLVWVVCVVIGLLVALVWCFLRVVFFDLMFGLRLLVAVVLIGEWFGFGFDAFAVS